MIRFRMSKQRVHSSLNYSFGNNCAFYYSIHLVNIRGSRVAEMWEARVHDWGVRAGFGVRQ